VTGVVDGLRVLDLTPPHARMAGRILSDLGADVVLVEPPGGCPSRREPPYGPGDSEPTGLAFLVWNAGKTSVASDLDDSRVADLVAAADVVLAGGPAAGPLTPADAPRAAWVSITAYGASGPRAAWRASDLTIVAAGGNLYPTGDPDRAPVRCAQPTSQAHTGPEVALAALTAVASGTPQLVDVSMQEAFAVASMTGPARYPVEGDHGRRRGAFTGRTRETWPCADGWVSFGLRGGRARVRNLQTLTKLAVEDGVATPALTDRDWAAYDHRTASDDELAAISDAVAAFFAKHTMTELYDMAVDTGLMLAPTNSPREITTSEQLAARGFLGPLGALDRVPQAFVVAGPDEDLVGPRGEAPQLSGRRWPDWPAEPAEPAPYGALASSGSQDAAADARRDGEGAWAGLKVVELGSGAAGPIATRYFAEHGATVVRVESKSRPDFLRSYAAGPNKRHGVEGSIFFSVLNAGKRSVTLDLKHPDGLAVAKRLVAWADVVSDNFAPGAMDRLGLGRTTMRELNPAAILVSTSLNGQTGPHRDYPGFGGQGAALSGYTFLTGWPDRAPVGPMGTITDSLAPSFVAAAVAAALLRRRRIGEGADLDLSQVEAAIWTLSPWIADWTANGEYAERNGNRHPRACPHGVFPAAGDDRWVALACWDDADWARLRKATGIAGAGLDTLPDRQERIDEVERAVAGWTRERSPVDAAEALQKAGVDAYPVNDWADLHDDPQLAVRRHFVPLEHPVMGEHVYEQSGFRLAATPGGVRTPGPTLGQHNAEVLGGLLGMTGDEIADLDGSGALS
jgi:crotonobetainyl-CoA:carnitine CoA-transferase CaiB-like acyl-CoA transferase